ncbi:MAG: 23S rRNA (guanosine(2251)-2'-O)-methyltransferase RlmB, partial [Lachnospiraceae bacterium]|nr:23S rRNA (guanosine(2251)-2'-O)-methyltransferase RlmB [Lachnospiraceae bacterium]
MNRLLILDGCHDAPVDAIRREAKKLGLDVQYVTKERLDLLSESGHHQGVIAFASAHAYASLEDIFLLAESRNEKPFIFLLDSIEDPHNLGAIIRTANVCGAHGVIIPKNRAAALTATVEKAAAGALSHTPVVRVTNLTQTIEALKKKGLWFVCADMDGKPMTTLDLKGAVGLVIGNEGSGVSPLVKQHCDLTASIPVRGEIASLNASVAAGVLAYEIVRQRTSA